MPSESMSCCRKANPLRPGATTRERQRISRLSVWTTGPSVLAGRRVMVSFRDTRDPPGLEVGEELRARATPPSVPRWDWRTSRSCTPSFSALRA